MYKLLEQLILQRIQPLIETATPVHQAGFRKHRSCTEQVMALTTHIEAGFQRQLKTGVVFVDLSAACVEGRSYVEVYEVPCVTISNLLNNMLSNRFFQVSIKQWFTTQQRLSSDIIQPIPSSSLNLFQYVR
jgi:hypothetical protein